jgi:hypothetical protein
MFHRDIKNADVLEVIRNGKMINEYPDDKPYPSFLMLGFINNRPIHVVLASDNENQVGIVITVYEPDPEIWTEDFVSRRNKL